MDPDFWHRRWERSEIGFHEGRPNELLARHWPALGVAPGSTVLVPLCGKAADMAWLAGQGQRVLGVELSAIAARDFFREHGLEPDIGERDGFQVHSAGGIEIWCGDLFDLRPGHLASVAAVYDRAALVALPAALQERYAATLTALVPPAAPTLLISLDYDQRQAAGPPFATSATRIGELYAPSFDITELERRDALPSSPNMRARGITWLEESARLLARKAAG